MLLLTSYSKYQLRSAGSWVLGVSLIRTDIDIDFSSLPPDMLDALPPNAPRHYSLNYNDYCLLGGICLQLGAASQAVAYKYYGATVGRCKAFAECVG